MSRTTLEVIGQGALGHSFDPLVKDVPNDYKDALKALAYAVVTLCFPLR